MPTALCSDDTCLSSTDHAASLAKSSSLHTVVAGVPPLPPPSTALTRSLVQRTDSVVSVRQSGWYNARKTYRSVAFGTWQVGSARQLFSQSQSDFTPEEDGHSSMADDSRRRCKFGMNGPSVSFDYNRSHAVRPQTASGGYHTIAAPIRPRAPLDSTASDGVAGWRYSSQDSGFSGRSDVPDVCGSQVTLANSDYEGDCFSADDYKRFHRLPDGREIDTDVSAAEENDSEMDQNLQTVMDSFRELHQYASLRRPSKSKRYGKKRPQLFGHKRSHSAGNAAIFAVRTLPPEPTPASPANAGAASSSGGVGAFQATKNFLKRLYQSTTSREASTTAAVNNNHALDGGTDTTASSVDSGYHGSDRVVPVLASMPSSVPSLATAEQDCACSSPPLSPPPRPGPGLAGREFKSWNDVFDHLRREITTIRERDMRILRDFQQLEGRLCELRTVKRPGGPSPIVEVAPNLEYDLASERCLTESMEL